MQPSRFTRPARRSLAALLLTLALVAAACGDDVDTVDNSQEDVTETTATPDSTDEQAGEAPVETATTVRDSGMILTVQPAGDLTVHSLVAPDAVFANSTHIIELANSLVVIDTQFLLPNAADVRAYADGLGKPIDRVFITHEHPDHFLGSEAFADVPVYALADVSDAIAANGQAEVDEKQADFGDAIASSFVTPQTVEPGTLDIDGTTFQLDQIVDAEAEVQLVIRVPDAGIIATGDIIYSGVHLILAGPIDTWTAAIEEISANSDDYPIVLPGHGAPTNPDIYEANTQWLATAGELLATVDNSADFKQGLLDAYPNLTMDAAIDFVFPFMFPDE